ncbi:uncharacterized protein LOC144149786 [Haemaphysalis longicornis]
MMALMEEILARMAVEGTVEMMALKDCDFILTNAYREVAALGSLYNGLVTLMNAGFVSTCSPPGWLENVVTVGCYMSLNITDAVYNGTMKAYNETEAAELYVVVDAADIEVLVELAGKPPGTATVTQLVVPTDELIITVNSNATYYDTLTTSLDVPYNISRCVHDGIKEVIHGTYLQAMVRATQLYSIPAP